MNSKTDPSNDLKSLSNRELLKLMQNVTAELKVRGAVRTKNVTGDYAEHLISNNLNLVLETSSKKSIDAYDLHGRTYQIKSRQLSINSSTPTIKSLRSFDFDYLILVIFNPDYSINYCGKMTSALAKKLSTPNPRVNGYRLNLTKKLLSNSNIEKVEINDV